MPFLYCCEPCERKHKRNAYFRTQQFEGHHTICPICKNNTAKFRRTFKNNTVNTRFALGRVEREKMVDRSSRSTRGIMPSKYKNPNFVTPDVTEVLQKYDPQMDRGAEDDPEYVPKSDFTPAMRFTDPVWGNASFRIPASVATIIHTDFKMTSNDHKITGACGRTDTGTEMARALRNSVAPLRKVSAFTWANWKTDPPTRGKSYKVDKKRSLEWCHLIADSLGGPTHETNLVAASYGANTFMMTIEEKLNAKTNLTIQVTAECSSDHVAEFIYYTIKKSSTIQQTWLIDARNDNFSQADYDKYGKEVSDFIK